MKYAEYLDSVKNDKYTSILIDLINIGLKSKDIVLDFYNKGFSVKIKKDDSPVTQADLASNKFITSELKRLYKDYAILSEEDIDSKTRLTNDNLFIVDPIDGTTDFINKDGEFVINLAYAYKHVVKVGVIVVPCLNKIYFSCKDNYSYEYDLEKDIVSQIHVSSRKDNLIMLKSRTHPCESSIEKELKPLVKEIRLCGSAYKACLVSKGEADLYFTNSSFTKEWDVAPIDIIVRNAGGVFVDFKTLKPFVFNRENPYNENGYYCLNSNELLEFIKEHSK